MWKGEIDLIEWRPPPKRNVASTPAQVGGEPRVQDKLDARIKQILESEAFKVATSDP
jgi:hypothetical protein